MTVGFDRCVESFVATTGSTVVWATGRASARLIGATAMVPLIACDLGPGQKTRLVQRVSRSILGDLPEQHLLALRVVQAVRDKA